MREGKLTLRPIESLSTLTGLVEETFSDPEVRLGIGWQPEDDTEEAMAAIQDLFERRFEQGWTLWQVTLDGRGAGLAGLGPIDPEDGSAWYAIYLTLRGQGLGTRVTERVVERARQRGVETLVAVMWAENEASRALMTGQGFAFAGPAPYAWAQESELDWVEYRLSLTGDARPGGR